MTFTGAGVTTAAAAFADGAGANLAVAMYGIGACALPACWS
jgi:hypothetical protein